ncbi:MAG: relaxase/mobilization nuclease domain-containing protein [Clostridia bacterium]
MAKLIILNNEYDSITALKNVFDYVSDLSKSNGLVGAQNILLDSNIEQLTAVNRYFYDNTKKKVIHFIIAFAPYDCISPTDALFEGYRICALLPQYQIQFGVHQNTDDLHIHFAMNPISLYNGHKFYFDQKNLLDFISKLRGIFKPYEININYRFSDDPNDFSFSDQLTQSY